MEQQQIVLVLDDEPLVAIDIKIGLSDAGFTVVALTSSTDAEQFLMSVKPDAAVLDVHLRNGESSAIAGMLAARSTPFVVCSGRSAKHLDEIFKNAPFVGKPCTHEAIVAAVEAAIASNRIALQRG